MYANGDRHWFQNGVLHRDKGPAVIKGNGTQLFYKHGKYYIPKETETKPLLDQMRGSYKIALGDGTTEWRKDGILHRNDDLPTIEYSNGKKEWYKDDKLHRDGDLPAVEHSDGSKEWYQNGLLHREDNKPAIIKKYGSKAWYLEGIKYTPKDVEIRYELEHGNYKIHYNVVYIIITEKGNSTKMADLPLFVQTVTNGGIETV